MIYDDNKNFPDFPTTVGYRLRKSADTINNKETLIVYLIKYYE